MKKLAPISKSVFVLNCILAASVFEQVQIHAAEETTISNIEVTTTNTIQPTANINNDGTLISEKITEPSPVVEEVTFESVDMTNSPTDKIEEKKVIDNELDITVFSDIHVLPEELISNNNEFTVAMNSDRKLFEESQAAFIKSLELAEQNKSKAIFITGDLTKDGEFESHQYVADKLKEFKERHPEVKIFVIPGNHDINNNHAVNYNGGANGGKAVPATITTPEMYFNNYKEIISDDSTQFYKDSEEFLNYIAEVNSKFNRLTGHEYYAQGYTSYVNRMDMGSNKGQNGVTVIGLDTAQYSADTTKSGKDGVQDTNGQISEAQISWVVRMAKEAQQRNDVIMLLSHHAFMPHFYKQEMLLSPYIIKQWNTPFISDNQELNGKTPAEVLADAGIQYLFTGHMHAQDIAKYESKLGNTFYDIETGSTVSTPSPIRHLKLTNQIDAKDSYYTLDVKSETLGSITYTDKDKNVITIEDLTEHGKGNLITPELVSGLASYYINSPQFENMTIQSLLGMLSDNFAHSQNIPNDLITMLGSMLGTKDSPKVMNVGPGELTIYYGDIEKTLEDDKKIALNVKANIMGFINVDEPLMISQDNAGKLLEDFMNQFNTKVLADKGQINTWIHDLATDLLNYELVTDANGDVKTLSDVANFAYIGHLKGDEVQPEWIKAAVDKLRNENVISDMLKSVTPQLSDILLAMAEKIEYHTGNDPLNIMYLLEYDKAQAGTWDDMIKGVAVSALGSNLKDTLSTAGIDKDKIAFLLQDKVLGNKAINDKLLPLNAFVSTILDGITREPVDGYPNAYTSDNNTQLRQSLDLSKLKGIMIIDKDGKVNFEHNFDASLLKDIFFIVNGEKVTDKELTNLKDNDDVKVMVQYRNQWGNFISYLSNQLVYKTPTKTIEQIFEKAIGYNTIEKKNPELPLGETKILVGGTDGKQVTKHVQVVDINGNPIGDTVISMIEEISAVDRVIEIGTKVVEAEEKPEEKPGEEPEEKPEEKPGEEPEEKPEEDKKISKNKSSKSVSKNNSKELPTTGENDSTLIFSAAALSILAGLGIQVSNKKSKEEL